jgi:hypothetical protein
MAALDFPSLPTPGQLYPSPAVPGVSQYQWDNVAGVWNTVATFVKLNSQSAYNSYVWPLGDGTAGQQLETDGAGNLFWANASDPTLFILVLDTAFDGIQTTFNLVDPFTTNVYTPTPSTNIEVFLGGVAQDPLTAYTITGSQINFTQAPLTNTNFFAFTTVQQ